ncbi:MAG: zf-HC2 domain-containing protein [Deltaproteobacteria bacterium]
MTNKNCQQITDLVFHYLNDNLGPSVKRDFQKHLRICPDCVHFLNTYKKTVSITGTVRPEKIPTKVKDNILDFLRKRTRKSGAHS